MYIKLTYQLTDTELKVYVSETDGISSPDIFLVSQGLNFATFRKVVNVLEYYSIPSESQLTDLSLELSDIPLVRTSKLKFELTESNKELLLRTLDSIVNDVRSLIDKLSALNTLNYLDRSFTTPYPGTISYAYFTDYDDTVYLIANIQLTDRALFVVNTKVAPTRFLRVANLSDLENLGENEAASITRASTIKVIAPAESTSGDVLAFPIIKELLDDLTTLYEAETLAAQYDTTGVAADVLVTEDTGADEVELTNVTPYADSKNLIVSVDTKATDLGVMKAVYIDQNFPGHARKNRTPEIESVPVDE